MPLHLHELGPAGREPVVALHGLTGHGGRFARLAQRIGRRILAPDLRGHGRSTWEPPWNVERHVADVLEVMPQRRSDLIGFSFGGLIAAALTAAEPERVARLVLLDPSIALPPALASEKAQVALTEETFGSHDEAIEAKLSGGTLFSTPRELLEEDVREHLFERPDGRLQERYCRPLAIAAWSEMARPAPPVRDVATLLVTGERSWIPVDAARWAHAEHAVVPGGHSVLWDDLEAVADSVGSFLG